MATTTKKKPAKKAPKPKATGVATHITMILDRSGSMNSIADDVIGAVNKFIKDQQAVPGECSFTLVQFDTQNSYEVVFDGEMKDAKLLDDKTYIPRAGTPLWDAVGRGIANTAEKKLGEKKVVLVVETDGYENSSREYTKEAVKKLIEDRKDWHFIFLGANIDAMAVGGGIGTQVGNTANYAPSAVGIQNANKVTSSNVAVFRATGQSASLCYTDEQRASMMGKADSE